MRRILLLLLLLVPAVRADDAFQARAEKQCREITATLEAWLGKKFERPVPVAMRSKDEIVDFARELAKTTIPHGLFEAAQRLAERLHQVPKGYDLFENELAMVREGVAGLYDPDEDSFYVVRGTGSPGSPIFTITVAHELVHAYRDVDKDYWERTKALVDHDTDWMQAVRFLVEGDAQFLGMVVGQAALTGQDPDAMLPLVTQQAAQRDFMLKAALADPRLADFPLVLKETLVAAYIEGMVFAVRLHEARGLEGLAAAYDHPPRSTEQILHPEKYLGPETDEPMFFTGGDPTAALGEGFSLVVTGTMGEFDVRVLFTEALGREAATDAAAGWDGARFWFLEKEGHPGFIGLISTWDTEDDALAFAGAWARWAARRDGGERKILAKDWGFAVETAEGLVAVRAEGKDVLVADGVPPDRLSPVFGAMRRAERTERSADARPPRLQ